MELFIIGLLIAIIIALITWMVFKAVKILKDWAMTDKFFTIVKEPEVKVILKGGKPFDCISNVSDHTMLFRYHNGKKVDWTLVDNKDLKKVKFEKYHRFNHEAIGGYYFYGILPNISIASFDIDAARWVDEPANIRESISHAPITVTSLRAKTQRRVLFKDVEVGGESTLKIDVTFTVIMELEKPLVAGFDRKGDFAEIVDASLKEIVVREALTLTDDDLFASSGAVKKYIFDPKALLTELGLRGNNMRNSGYKAVALIYHGYDFTPDSMPIVQKKAEAKEAEYQREQQRQKSLADKLSRELEGAGRASAINDQLRAQVDLGVNPDVAAHNFARMIVAEAIGGKDSDVAMFIEQGAGIQFAPGMIPPSKRRTP
jgi:hypothetical protein